MEIDFLNQCLDSDSERTLRQIYASYNYDGEIKVAPYFFSERDNQQIQPYLMFDIFYFSYENDQIILHHKIHYIHNYINSSEFREYMRFDSVPASFEWLVENVKVICDRNGGHKIDLMNIYESMLVMTKAASCLKVE